MRLSPEVQLPPNPDTAYTTGLVFQLRTIFRVLVAKVNAMADGRLSAIDNAATTPPTTGLWAPGDQVRNSNPTELGAAGSKYVIEGWIYTSTGWVQKRFLTGN